MMPLTLGKTIGYKSKHSCTVLQNIESIFMLAPFYTI